MATIKIGDEVCEFEGEKTVMQVALENGIEIPRYCYHPGLSVVASCRICVAEVAQPNPKTGELQTLPKMVPTCAHPAVDGAEVYLQSERTRANQKAVMEYLLVNHPLDCPVCDQAGECYLQDYSYRYGRAFSRFEETKVKQPKKDVGPHTLLYSDRCIMCDRCVRFTNEISGTGELGRFQRGNRTEIDIFPGHPLDNELSGNVIDICPVGAFLDKDFLMQQRVWFLNPVPSIDPITASGDNLWLDENEGYIWRVRPRENQAVNQWWTSDEIRYGWKFVHDDERLRHPRIKFRSNPDGEPIRWDDALQAATTVLEGRRLGVMISPMLSCEDAAELTWLAKALDGDAVIGVGPIPRVGEDKTFPGGYTIYAEKAPNARGVRRAVERITGEAPLDYETWLQRLNSVEAVLLTGNYPSAWATDELAHALDGKGTVLIDTLPNRLTDRVDIVLPAATWAEKTGTFENANNRLQRFDRALQPFEFVRPEGQVARDLLAAAGKAEPRRHDPATVREQLGGAFVTDVHPPTQREDREPDMQYVEI